MIKSTVQNGIRSTHMKALVWDGSMTIMNGMVPGWLPWLNWMVLRRIMKEELEQQEINILCQEKRCYGFLTRIVEILTMPQHPSMDLSLWQCESIWVIHNNFHQAGIMFF